MTINATAMWLLGMYLALADEQGVALRRSSSGTTQNDILKEYLSRGTYIFPPEASKRLTVDLIAYTVKNVPDVEPDQRVPVPPAGGGRDAGAGARVRARQRDRACSTRCATRARSPPTSSPRSSAASRSSSTRASASSKRCARCARSPQMWDRICRERYGVTDEKLRRFRYGMQVNSLGLTEEQPENNVQRIVLEMLGVTLSKDARARADPAAVLERGARAADAVGPAVVAAHPAGARVRVRPARVRRPVRRARRSSRRKVAELRRGRRGRAAVGARRRRLVRDDRRDEGPARAEPRRARAPHRVGRAEGRRRELVHRDRAVAARRRSRSAAAS